MLHTQIRLCYRIISKASHKEFESAFDSRILVSNQIRYHETVEWKKFTFVSGQKKPKPRFETCSCGDKSVANYVVSGFLCEVKTSSVQPNNAVYANESILNRWLEYAKTSNFEYGSELDHYFSRLPKIAREQFCFCLIA